VDEAAEMLHVALAGGVEHRAGTEEEQALEHRVIEDVQEAGGERERGGGCHAVRLEGERKAHPDENDADVLDRVIGKQPLEVVLHQRIEHAHHRGDAGEREHHHAPPPGRLAGEVKGDCARSRRPRPWSSHRS